MEITVEQFERFGHRLQSVEQGQQALEHNRVGDARKWIFAACLFMTAERVSRPYNSQRNCL